MQGGVMNKNTDSLPTPIAMAAADEIGADVGRLLGHVPTVSRQYRETGRQAAARTALARWPLLGEIQHGAYPAEANPD